MKMIIGVDFGKDDISCYTVAESYNNTYKIIDTGIINNLDLSKYPNAIITGETEDVELLKIIELVNEELNANRYREEQSNEYYLKFVSYAMNKLK